MDMDIKSITQTIEDFASNIEQATKAMEGGGGLNAVMPFAGTIQSTFNKIQSLGTLEGVHISQDMHSKLCDAIDHLMKSTKAAEQAAPQAVALLGVDAVNKVKDHLQLVLDRMDEERGKKITGAEPGKGM